MNRIKELIQKVLYSTKEDETGMSNVERWDYCLNVMAVKEFDILSDVDFQYAYENANGHALQAAMWLADLKMQIYKAMSDNFLGNMNNNSIMYYQSIVWRRKFIDKVNAYINKTEIKHIWIN